MPYRSQTTDFWGWYLRHNTRIEYSHFNKAGIDVFSSGPNQNEDSFLDLQNVLPAMSGGFRRRWGTSVSAGPFSTSSNPINPVRMFPYNAFQDQTDATRTSNENLWVLTDNATFSVLNDSGTAFSGYTPAFTGSAYNASSYSPVVGAVTSRNWFYYTIGNGSYIPQKIDMSYTTNVSTQSNWGAWVGNTASTNGTSYDYTGVPVSATSSPPSSGATSTALSGLPSTVATGMSVNITANISGSASGWTGIKPWSVQVQYSVNSGVTWTNMRAGYSAPIPGSFSNITITSEAFSVTNIDTIEVRLSVGGIATSGTVSGTLNSCYVTIGDVVIIPTSWVTFDVVAGNGSNYTSPTVSFSGGGGTGAAASAILQSPPGSLSNYLITGYTVTNGGSGYTSSPLVIITDSTGTGAQAMAYVDLNKNNGTYGQVVAVLPMGPMEFAAGRSYTGAFQNSFTGHASDINYTASTTLAAPLAPSSLEYVWAPTAIEGAAAGWNTIAVQVTINNVSNLDPQLNTVIVLATSDGGSLESLYEVQMVPTSSFTASGSSSVYSFYDTMPDSYTDSYLTGNTLLDANLWVEPDGSGGTVGIAGNSPPPIVLFYPVAHQGRLFGTDGKSVFYSKSLDEVTTSTGLITSKWEEAWPGTYVLPIALDNEVITAMKSDGQVLHVGTDKAIYSVYGTDPSSFSVPATQFAQTGILSNDLFTVIYNQGQPAGFMWMTPDYKIIYSDFNTYQDIGTQIYPLISNWDTSFTQGAKMSSITYGPYNFVFFSYKTASGTPQILVYETSLRSWYRWTTPAWGTNNTLLLAFVYQSPVTGNKFLYFTSSSAPFTYPGTSFATGYQWSIFKFDPTQTQDNVNGVTSIPWNVQTTWQSLGDSFAFKVLNEMEIISDEAALVKLSIYGANTQNNFDSPFVICSNKTFAQGPLNPFKSYLAGLTSPAKFYSFQFSNPSTTSGTATEVLTSFTLETFPMARI